MSAGNAILWSFPGRRMESGSMGTGGCSGYFRWNIKKGSPKESEADILQMTARAMCLEEMLSARIDAGALYYGEIHRRNTVEISDELRKRVSDIVQEMHELYDKGYTPKARGSKSCNACSMKDICMPVLITYDVYTKPPQVGPG